MKTIRFFPGFVTAAVTRLLRQNPKPEIRNPKSAGASLRRLLPRWSGVAVLAMTLLPLEATAAEKKIVLVAGRPSHGPGDHEFRAGSLLLKKCLDNVPGVQAIVVTNGWPKDETVFDGAAAIMFFADGGGGHPAIQGDRLQKIDALVKKGAGIACVHYGVEVPKEKGGKEFIEWIGGYFEMHWSVNPHWDAEFKEFPVHPITRGVKPFKIRDEWYYHMRFREGMKGVMPILSALPPDTTLNRPDGPHSGNPAVREAVRKGEPQHVAWAYERPDGGRGFGFTGAHYHRNWGDDNFRKLVLNALLWVARMDVPANGVECNVTPDDLKQNLDPKGK
jgi:trehalose utilization protein